MWVGDMGSQAAEFGLVFLASLDVKERQNIPIDDKEKKWFFAIKK